MDARSVAGASADDDEAHSSSCYAQPASGAPEAALYELVWGYETSCHSSNALDVYALSARKTEGEDDSRLIPHRRGTG